MCYECLLDRPATFAWQTHEYIKITKQGTEKFNDLIRNITWSEVIEKFPKVDEMVESFQNKLDDIMSACFSWKRVRRKSNHAPWLSDGLRQQIKKRLAIFRTEGRSARWKRLDSGIKNTIELRKAAYFERESEKLKEAGRNASWYSILTCLLYTSPSPRD